MKKILHATLLVFLVMHEVLGVSSALAQTTGSTTTYVPADETGFSVDVAKDCKGVPEDAYSSKLTGDGTSGGFEISIPKEWPALLHAPIPTWTFPLGHIDWGANNFTDFLNSLGFSTQSEGGPPILNIQTAMFSVNEGDTVELQAEASNFKSPLNKIEYAWWNVKKNGTNETLYSLNGVVAGGEAFGPQDVPVSNGTRCGVATRKPLKDVDGDSMDDEWELRYAPHGDISAFKPNDDPDKDGFVSHDFQQNDTGEFLQVAPDSQAKNGKKFVTGDGEFTNLEEYLWGTNPYDADTDDDGYADEADVSGVAQNDLKYLPPDILGQSQTIEVDAMGESMLKGLNENLVTAIVGYRVDIPTLLQQNVRVDVISNSASPQLGEKFRVQAISSGTTANIGNLQYEWSITSNDVPVGLNTQGGPCALLGFNDAVECNFPSGSIAAGQRVIFAVKIFDPKLGIRAEGSTSVPIGSSVVVTTNPTLIPQYPIDPTGEQPVAPQGNLQVGERWVEITANLTEGSPENYTFEWYVDDGRIGIGCSKAPLTFTGKAEPTGIGICGVGTNILYYHAMENNSHVYKINVRVFDKINGDRLANEYINVYTDPTPMPYPGKATIGSQSLLRTSSDTVMPNQNIVVSALNVETSETHTYQYVWSVDGQVVANGSKKQIELTAKPEKKQYEIELQLLEKVDGKVVSQKIASTTVGVAPVTKYELWRNERLAAVQSIFYPFYHTVIGNTSLFLVGAGIVIIIFVFLLDRKKVII